MTGSNTPQNPPPPPKNPPPSRPPTKPPRQLYGLAALVADAECQLSGPLHLLVAAVLDADCSPADRAHLNAAAQHVSLALSRLAFIQTPARQSEPVSTAATIATPGEPDTFTTPQPLGPPRFTAGQHRPVGRVERVGA